MKKYIVVFGTKEYTGTIELLLRSVEKMVDNIFVYSEDNISNGFREKNAAILNKPRGYGYWIWKPYFILKTLDCINDGDICLYVDAGVIAIDNINILFDICRTENGMLLFENRCGNKNGDIWKNIMWTKYDCFNLMGCISENYKHGNQVEASFQLYEKNNKSIEFLKEYMKYCENENIVTDLPSVTGSDFPGFMEHRHDQSVLSLLAIKYNVKTERSPTQWTEHLINSDSKYKTLFFQHKLKLDISRNIPIHSPTLYSKFKVLSSGV